MDELQRLIQLLLLFFAISFSVPRPNMDKYVFMKVLENQEQVMIDPEYVLFIYMLMSVQYVFTESINVFSV